MGCLCPSGASRDDPVPEVLQCKPDKGNVDDWYDSGAPVGSALPQPPPAPTPLRAGTGILLYIVYDPSGEKVPVELPVDATVAELKAAIHAAGGPWPHEQVLAVGAERISDNDCTPLSDTAQVSNEAVVTVTSSVGALLATAGSRAAVLLDEGSVLTFVGGHITERAVGAGVSSLAVSDSLTAVVIRGRVDAWGSAEAEAAVKEGLESVRTDVRSVAACYGVLFVLDVEGVVHLIGDARACSQLDEVQRKVTHICSGTRHFCALTYDGCFVKIGWDGQFIGIRHIQLSGRVRSMAAGARHIALLMDDGSVRCCGDNAKGQCSVPADLGSDSVWVSCGDRSTVAVRRDGSLCWWGERSQLQHAPLSTSGVSYCAAIFCQHAVHAVTADGSQICTEPTPSSDEWMYMLQSDVFSRPDLKGRRVALGRT
eukprot:TRINITY_DN9041_c0_g3_i1.p1 TRINITY_DN9041_c0_g3~~TRINITY_DN9041_c0_g3_i1.p1  ORF type:complete len:426 (+),score=118.24 TRINITY_DN9041_c0_g3_i1:52-1329(+)